MAVELGAGYVSVFAQMKGFNRDVARGITSAGASAGKGFAAAFSGSSAGAADRAKSEMDRLRKAADEAAKAAKSSGDAVEAATKKAATARTAEEAAARKVAIAEKRLEELRSSGKAKASQLLAAEDAVKRAREAHAKATDRAESETKQLSAAQQKLKIDTAAANRAQGDAQKGLESYERVASGIGGKIKGLFSKAFGAIKPKALMPPAGEFASTGAESGRAFGSGLTGALGSIKTGILQGIGQGLVGAVGNAVGKVKGLLSGAVGGGFARLMNIEQAEIKLKTLGLDVKTAMDAVDESVTGTKFAISDAADMAAFLGASGIKSSKQMTQWLSRTADAAQFTNREFSDMQAVIGKVVAEGRVTGETFQQLPLAAAALADHLGISQAEVRKLASQGKISADQLGAALDKKIGGAAKNAGASFLSMRDNIKTALNATMANLLKPLTKAAMPIMGSLLNVTKTVRDKMAKPLGEAFAKWLQPKAQVFADKLAQLPGVLERVAGGFKKFGGVVKEITGGFRAFAVAFRKGDGDITSAGFPGWMEEIAFPIRQAFDGLKRAWEGFVEGFGGWDSIVETFKGVVPLLTGPLGLIKSSLAGAFGGADMGAMGKSVGENVKPLLESLASLGTSAAGAIAKILPPLLGVVQKLMPIVGQLAGKLAKLAAEVLPPLADLLGELVGLIGDELVKALEDFEPLISGAFEFLSETLQGATQTLSGVVQFVTGVFSGDWGKAWGGIEKATEGYWQQIGALPKAIMGEALKAFGIEEDVDSIMKRGTDRFFELIGQWWTDTTTWFSSTWTGITEFVSRPFLDAANAAKPMVDGIIGFVRWGLGVFGTAWKAITTLIMIPINAAKIGLGAAWNFITQSIFQPAWNWISQTFIGAWRLISGWLSGPINTAKNAIGAAWNFITKSIFQSAWNWISGTFKAAWGLLSGWLSGPVNAGKSGIATALGGIEGLFKGALKSIETIWNGLEGVIKAPIRWAIDRINDLLGIIRDVGGKVGIDSKSLPGNIGYPPGFAGGGILPGYRPYAAGDDQLVALRSGEGIYVSEAMRDPYERRRLHEVNRRALSGRSLRDMQVPGLAGGGLVPDPGRAGRVATYRPVPGRWTTYAGHNGIDFPVPAGTPVRAWRAGRVFTAAPIGTWGNYLRIDHGGGLWSGYAHLRRFLASPGMLVAAGQPIGLSGGVPGEPGAGNTTGPHLHWEIYRGGTRVFPGGYLDGSRSAGGLPGMGRGAVSNPVGDIVKGLLSPLLSPLMSLKAPFPGVFGQLMSAVPGFLGKKALDGAANIFKFDSGGQLQPGLTLAYNATSRPEPVLTGRQWDQLASGRDRVTAADIRRALDGMRIDLDNGRLWFDRHASARERQAGLAVRTA